MPYRIDTGDKSNKDNAALRPILKHEFDKLQESFRFFFGHADGGHVQDDYHLIEWDSLSGILPEGSSELRALKFYHGLGDHYYKVGIQVLLMVPVEEGNWEGEYELFDGPFYEEIGGRLFLADLHLWMASYRLPYYRDVRVRRGGVGSPPDILRGADQLYPDAGAVILPWELEVELLKRDNEKAIYDEYKVEVACGSAVHDNSDGGPSGYRHGVCLVMHARRSSNMQYERLLVHGAAVGTYKNNAADLGHLCPPRCKRYNADLLFKENTQAFGRLEEFLSTRVANAGKRRSPRSS